MNIRLIQIREQHTTLPAESASATPFSKKWMSTAVILFLCLAAFFFMNPTTSSGDTTSLSTEAKGPQHNSRKVRVGYTRSYGFLERTADKSYSGFGFEYLQEIARYTGWIYEMVPGSWSESLERLRRGEIDMMGMVQKTPAREKLFAFPNEESGREYGVLYTRDKNQNIFYDDFASMAGIRVGLVEGGYFNDIFTNFLAEKGISVQKSIYPDVAACLNALETNEIDAFTWGGNVDSDHVKIIARYAVAPFYFAVSKQRPDILKGLNDSLLEARKKDLYFEANLHNKYLKKTSELPPSLTREENQFIKTSPPVRIACDVNWPPVEFFDTGTGKVQGISVDLLAGISRKSGLTFEFIPTHSLSEGLSLLRSGQASILSGYSPSRSGSPYCVATLPYLQVPLIMVTRRDHTSLVQKVAVISGSHPSPSIREQAPDLDLVFFQTIGESFDALLRRDVDGALVESYLFDVVASPKYKNLHVVSVSEMTRPLSLGVAVSADPLLLSILDKTIAQISQNESDFSIITNMAARPTDVSLMWVLEEYLLEIAGIVLFIFLLIVAFLVYTKRSTVSMLTRLAYVDDVTGLWNRRKLELEYADIVTRDRMVLVVVDINNFRLLNDYFGYGAGNRALRHVASILRKLTGAGEYLARFPADIFALLLQYTDGQNLSERLKLFASSISEYESLERQNDFNITLAFGVYLITDASTNFNTANDRANIARKMAKNTHRTTYAFYDLSIHARLTRELEIENDMQKALEEEQFVVYYQPKYDLRTDEIAGAEALIRWNHPTRGLIAPDTFIPLFEKNGFVIHLDMYVLENVCKKIREWMDYGYHPVPISVNMSKLHMLNTDFVRCVVDIVQKYSIPTNLIELELTESAFLDSTELLLDIMHELTGYGFVLSMDDFGTGYSSLNMLKEIPVDILKIDRSFFDYSEASDRGKNIIVHVLKMARDLNMRVVSEGVETAQQAAFLKTMDCDMAQGYFYSRPLTCAAFETLLFSGITPHPRKRIEPSD